MLAQPAPLQDELLRSLVAQRRWAVVAEAAGVAKAAGETTATVAVAETAAAMVETTAAPAHHHLFSFQGARPMCLSTEKETLISPSGSSSSAMTHPTSKGGS